MRLPYRKEPVVASPAHPGRQSALRPRIRIRLTYRGRFVDLLALIDSGADDCLFPLGLANRLGLKPRPENVGRYVGIGPGEITAIFDTITLEVGDWSYTKWRSNRYYRVSEDWDDWVFGLTRQGMALAMPNRARKAGALAPEVRPSAAEAARKRICFACFTARLKSCPDETTRVSSGRR